jgi:hypothetical protein
MWLPRKLEETRKKIAEKQITNTNTFPKKQRSFQKEERAVFGQELMEHAL